MKADSTSMIVIGKQTRLKREDLKFLFKGKEMDDHEHLHASVKGESKMMLIDNLPTINEDRENSEEVKENVELMETIEENHQFPKQVSTNDDNVESKEERDHENKKKRKTTFTPAEQHEEEDEDDDEGYQDFETQIEAALKVAESEANKTQMMQAAMLAGGPA
ncbi:hypothetical protein Tco_0033023 [Tanacetum coccineum]